MIKQIETERLILRAFLPTDDEAMFELDSDPLVHKYLGNNPVKTIEQSREVIKKVQQQYIDNGIGRWAAIEKASGAFIGWSGLKLNTEMENNQINFYDVGYRLIPKYWGKGYATESARAAIKYGFEEMQLSEIIGTVNIENNASQKALEKCGLQYVESFQWHDIPCHWLKITREEWLVNQQKTN